MTFQIRTTQGVIITSDFKLFLQIVKTEFEKKKALLEPQKKHTPIKNHKNSIKF